ncbi:LOW QUALITY PROTEIN: DNA ligase 3-like [Pecten maximus]|uniref:LOW QUALITY PROTEIN: DNA ligase 3-like n=1 Tax=Pecten maximus TaxID=6579 RepID=UPI001458E3BE|nr:LOW QUALITY PROTEIN: DNA ligase 3-like [Pecten maximus]
MLRFYRVSRYVCRSSSLVKLSTAGNLTASCHSKLTSYSKLCNNLLTRKPTPWTTLTLLRPKNYCEMADNRYVIGYAKLGTSGCKGCKTKIEKGSLRIGKVTANPFGGDGDMKQWYHPSCIFNTFKRARATTKKIEEPDDVEGFSEILQEDKDEINKLIKEHLSNAKTPNKKTPKAATPQKTSASPAAAKSTPSKSYDDDDAVVPSTSSKVPDDNGERDDAFREFRRLCAEIADESSYNSKTALVAKYLKKGASGEGYTGDTYILLKLLLPGVVKRVYNLNNKQLVKLFSQIFGTSLQAMVADLDQGDVAETVRIFFEKSKNLVPVKKSTLTLQQVDYFLEELSLVTKEEDQQRILTKIAKRCTLNDLKMMIRLIKHDLRINAGAKHILEGLDTNAYAAFQASRDLHDVVARVRQNLEEGGGKPGMAKKLTVRANLMTPVLPMLAEACRSVQFAMKRCPNGFYAEIKYDGERVQLHKKGSQFSYFSRSLKPVQPHKVDHFKEHIPKAFPSADDIILDAEVLLVDTATGKPLPFGTLGVHKKAQFSDAKVCLFVFDCLHINGENIMDKPIKTRRKILHENMTEIEHHVMFSEMQHIKEPDDLQDMMNDVFRQGLEGLVLKDVNGIYEPGKRHWLKIKKDYLEQGTMADSADLVVLGAYFGSGNKGGIMSVFLFGVHDPDNDQWCTVTKCHSGLDDKTLDELQTKLDMVKISKDARKIPDWLNIKKQLVPDFVIRDPKKAPVWEIAGAEFTQAEIHTADGISIRFPRITKFRDDKSWKEATNLPRLKELFKKSKETSDLFPSSKKGNSSVKRKGSQDSDDNNSNSNGHPNGGGSATPVKGRGSASSTPVKGNGSETPSKASPGKTGTLAGWVKRGEKRSRSEDSDEASSPKKKMEISPSKRKDDESPSKKSSKPLCKYSSDCYQTNPAHIEQYYHPTDHKLPKPGERLPNVFSGTKIFLSEDTDKYRLLKRYIIGFDGDLVNDFQKKTATHVIVKPGQAVLTSGSCVTVDWLWNSIKKKMKMPLQKFRVT